MSRGPSTRGMVPSVLSGRVMPPGPQSAQTWITVWPAGGTDPATGRPAGFAGRLVGVGTGIGAVAGFGGVPHAVARMDAITKADRDERIRDNLFPEHGLPPPDPRSIFASFAQLPLL